MIERVLWQISDTMKKLGHGSTRSTLCVSHFRFQQQPQVVLLETRQLDRVFSSRDRDSGDFSAIFSDLRDATNDARHTDNSVYSTIAPLLLLYPCWTSVIS